MSAFPVVLEGSTLDALVVGGGAVGTRKVRSLLDAGARVEVVSPRVTPELEALAVSSERLRISRIDFAPGFLDGRTIVFAATDDAAVNAEVARLARARGIPVNVADDPEKGTFVSPAVHRAGDVVVAVSAGRVPMAAARIRDAIAATIDGRFAGAVRELSTLRRSLLDGGDRTRWQAASSRLIGSDFVSVVESGAFAARVDEWR